MPIDRRALLVGAGAVLLSPGAPALGGRSRREVFAAAGQSADGGYAAGLFSLTRGEIARVALPGRGHDIAVRPGTGACVIFARSPGRHAVVLHPDRRSAPIWFETRPDRHFCGHGAFSSDGRLLFASENDYEGARGIIGVRDATDGYRRIGEFPSDGLEPHDLLLLSDGRTLVVANGGVQTHPDFGGRPLNLASMRPSLSYIDIRTGDVLETHTLDAELHRLSIRHLSLGEGDRVVFACQHKGPRTERPRLVGLHRRGEDLRLLEMPSGVLRAMRNYVGSVQVDGTGEIAAASSPRGGIVVFFHVAARRYLGQARLDGICGIAPRHRAAGFLLTGIRGALALCGGGEAFELAPQAMPGGLAAWDNHAVALGAV